MIPHLEIWHHILTQNNTSIHTEEEKSFTYTGLICLAPSPSDRLFFQVFKQNIFSHLTHCSVLKRI